MPTQAIKKKKQSGAVALGDERRYARRNEIKEITFHEHVTGDSTLIKTAFVEHFRNLLGQNTQVEEGFERDFLPLMPQLDKDVRGGLEAPISVREVERAINEFTPGKSPGPDGLSADFYKFFKHKMVEALQCVITEAYKEKT